MSDNVGIGDSFVDVIDRSGGNNVKQLLMTLFALGVAAALVFSMLTWIPGPFEGTWRAWELNPSVLTVTSSQPELDVEQTEVDIAAEMRDAVPQDARIRGARELTLRSGELPAEGAILTFSLERAISSDRTADIAFWNSDRQWWEPVPTTISADRRVLTATAAHFSVWAWIEQSVTEAGGLAYNGLGQLTGGKVDEPSCDDTKPDWAAPIFVDDRNNIVLWCYDDGDTAGELRVKLRLNRPYLGLVHLAIPARTARSNLPGSLGSNPQRVEQIMLDSGLDGTALAATGYPVAPLGEYTFVFGKTEIAEFFRTSDAPLIDVTASPLSILAGELMRVALEKASDNKALAVPVALYTLATCGGGIISGASDGEPLALAGSVGDCLADNADDIARGMARYQLTRDPGMSWEDAVTKARNVGRVIGRAWVYWEGLKFSMRVSDVIIDLNVDPSARQFRFAPASQYMQDFMSGATGEDDGNGAAQAFMNFGGGFTDKQGYTFRLWISTGVMDQYSEFRDSPPGQTYARIVSAAEQTIPVWGIENTSDRTLAFAKTSGYVFPQASPVFQLRLLFDRSSIVCESLWRVTPIGSALPTCAIPVSIVRFTEDEPNLTLDAGIEKNMRAAADLEAGWVPGVAEDRYADVQAALAHPQGFEIAYYGQDADRFESKCGSDYAKAVLYQKSTSGEVCSLSSDATVTGTSQ